MAAAGAKVVAKDVAKAVAATVAATVVATVAAAVAVAVGAADVCSRPSAVCLQSPSEIAIKNKTT
jgi:hypothetical protein